MSSFIRQRNTPSKHDSRSNSRIQRNNKTDETDTNDTNTILVKEWLNSDHNHIKDGDDVEPGESESIPMIDADDEDTVNSSCSDYGSSETEDNQLNLPVFSHMTWYSQDQLRTESTLNKEFKQTLNSAYSDYNAYKTLVENSCDMAAKSRLSIFGQRARVMIKHYTSPNINPLNIRLLGSKLEVALQRKRVFESDFVIHPLSSFSYLWDTIMLFVLLVYVIIIPLEIAFFDSEALLPFHIIWDSICIADIIINFRTGYCIYGDRYQLDTKEIANKYLKTWFPVDLITTLPLNYIFLTIYEGNSTGLKVIKIVKVMKLINLIKLLRLFRLTRIMAQYEEIYRLTVSIARYIKLVSLMLLLAHWNGCLQYFVPMLHDFPEGSWLHLYKLIDEPWYVKYGWSLFKTLSHMLCIGYGRFMPMLLSEAFVTLFTMITGATFYALFITNSVASRVQGTCSRDLFEEKLKSADEFLLNQEIPDEIRNKVDSYFSRKYPDSRYINEDEILGEMSNPLRENVLSITCEDVIASVPFLKNSPPQLVYGILMKSKTLFYLPGDIVIKEGRIPRDMYFIRSGELVITVKDRLMLKLDAGDYFGEIGVLTKQRRLFTVKTTRTSELLVISSEEFLHLLSDSPKSRVQLQHDTILRMKQLYNQYSYAFPETSKKSSLKTHRHIFQLQRMHEASFMDLFMVSLKCLVEAKYDLERIDDYDTERIEQLNKAISDILKSHMCSNNCYMCQENMEALYGIGNDNQK